MKYLKTYEELTKRELESELNDFFEAYYDDYDSVLFEPLEEYLEWYQKEYPDRWEARKFNF